MALDQSRKIRLVFYSGGQGEGNRRLHEAVSRLALTVSRPSSKRNRSLTYIPYSHENGEYFYKRICQRYKKYGFKKFRYFPVDSDFLQKEMNEALKSDVIYLAGGNTFYFLKHLRESGFLQKLVRFAKNGGVVAGLSAGAIIMTPHIYLAGYPPHEGDPNEVRLKNLKSMNLVDFEFLPHFNNSSKSVESLRNYSRRTNRVIFACPDGSGLVIRGQNMHLYGPIFTFYRGKKMRLI